MYDYMYCLYVGFDYTYIDKCTGSKFAYKPLLGLEPMAPIRPQLPVSHASHSATETYVCMCACMYVYVYVCMSIFHCT